MINDEDTTVYDFPTRVSPYPHNKDMVVSNSPAERLRQAHERRLPVKAGTNGWAAGVFDTRGWVRIAKTPGKHRMLYKVETYIRVTHEARAIELVGLYEGTSWNSNGKPLWTAQGATAMTFLRRIRPYVRWKRMPITVAERFERLRKRYSGKHFIPVPILEKFEEIRLELAGRVPPEARKGLAKDIVEADMRRFDRAHG